MSNQGDFKDSDKGPDNRSDKGSKNKLSKTRTILMRNNISKTFLQS